MKRRGLVVVVTATGGVRNAFAAALEPDDWAVLNLHDGGELYDFVEFVAEHPDRTAPLRLIVIDDTMPVRGALEVAAWARLKGMTVPFVLLTERDDARVMDLARAIGSVTLVATTNTLRARQVLRDALSP